MTDHYFPPIEEVGEEITFHAPAEYSNFTYWREPLPEINFELVNEWKVTNRIFLGTFAKNA